MPAKFTQSHPRFAPILAADVQLRAAVCDCLPLNGVLPDTPPDVPGRLVELVREHARGAVA